MMPGFASQIYRDRLGETIIHLNGAPVPNFEKIPAIFQTTLNVPIWQTSVASNLTIIN